MRCRRCQTVVEESRVESVSPRTGSAQSGTSTQSLRARQFSVIEQTVSRCPRCGSTSMQTRPAAKSAASEMPDADHHYV